MAKGKPRRKWSTAHVKRMAAQGRHPDGTPKMPAQMCIECGYAMDAATPFPGNARSMPKPGDATLCLNCGKLMLFDEHLRHREPTPHEWAYPQLIDLQARARQRITSLRYKHGQWDLLDKRGQT